MALVDEWSESLANCQILLADPTLLSCCTFDRKDKELARFQLSVEKIGKQSGLDIDDWIEWPNSLLLKQPTNMFIDRGRSGFLFWGR